MVHDDSQNHPQPSAAELLATAVSDDLPTGLDLAEVLQTLREQLMRTSPDLLRGYVAGKTRLRDALVSGLQCSLAQAELLIDTLEARGQIHFEEQDAPHGR